MINILEDLKAEFGLTLVIIAHDLAVIRHIADRVAVMYLGRMVEIGNREEIFNHPRHPYTRMLLDAVPTLEVGASEAPPPLGELPDPANPPSGCSFRTRCRHADAQCAQIVPRLEQANDHRAACLKWEEIA